MAIDTPARHIYSGDGSTRVFPIPTYIQGDDYIRIEINGVHQVDRSKWDIVNNSIIFVTAPEAEATIDVQVATSVEALAELGSVTNVDIVASNIASINGIASNLDEILEADNNATIAKQEAWRAEAERLTANSYATEPEDVFVKIYTSNNDGTFTITNTADYSSYHWERKATTLIIVGIIDDITSSADKTYSSNKIDGIVNNIEGNISTIEGNISTIDNTTVKITENQIIDDIKTFTSSPIVPTPTTDYQVVNKKYVDDNNKINTLTNKTTPADADELVIADITSSFSLKKLSFTNLKATLLTYFDTLYSRTSAIFGIGQTWQDVKASRSSGVTYTNNTGKPIKVSVTVSETANTNGLALVINGLTISYSRFGITTGSGYTTISEVIPNANTYSLTKEAGDIIEYWNELR